MRTSATCALAAVAPAGNAAAPPKIGSLVLNDDGHVFLYLSDDLRTPDLRRYLESYCKPGVNTVAYCVGDMSWPTFYPSKVGVPYTAMSAAGDLKRARAYKNLDNFAAEPGGYFGAVFAGLRDLGKVALASFRMNDAHFTAPDNPNVSEFWKKHTDLALGSVYGYYGGCLNYASDAVRDHFFQRVIEFAELYPEIDGIELDAMRSPFFFPPGEGGQRAPLFTDLVRKIKSALAAQAQRLNRPNYLLAINVPLTPELALECGLDVTAWDAERLFDCISVGTYQVYMNSPIEQWKAKLVNETPVFAYINCSPQTGRYLGLEEYRAAAANAYGCGADGVYVFNYPCLFELAMQIPTNASGVPMTLPDLRERGQLDLRNVAQVLDEIGSPDMLLNKDKRFLFGFSSDTGYRHFAPVIAGVERGAGGMLKAAFRCYEDFGRARETLLRFKIENVYRTESFQTSVNGRVIASNVQRVRYAANGRDTRIHTVTLGPYQEIEIPLAAEQLVRGDNTLEVGAAQLAAGTAGKINLAEIELVVRY